MREKARVPQRIIRSSARRKVSHDSRLDGLIAFWKLEEATGTRVDCIGSRDLTPQNSPSNASGKIGEALSLNGTSQYLSRASDSSLNLSSAITFSMWVYHPETSHQRAVAMWENNVSSDKNYWIGIKDTNPDEYLFKVNRQSGTETVTSTVSTGVNVWKHMMAWYDPTATTHGTIYISVNNETPQSNAIDSALEINTDSEFWVGRAADTYWDGRIDALGIYNKVLSDETRTLIYNSGRGWQPTNLGSYVGT